MFCLSQDQYKPSLRKRWGNSTVRIFEIPFRTEATGKVRILFFEQKAMIRLLPARENEAYLQLPGCDKKGGYGEVNPPFGQRKEEDHFAFGRSVLAPAGNLYYSNEDITGDSLIGILQKLEDGSHLEISNCNICNPMSREDAGSPIDGSAFVLTNVNMEGNAFCKILDKLGDGCNLDCTNINVSAIQGDYPGARSATDGCALTLTNLDISASAFGYLMATLDSGYEITLENVDVNEDGFDVDFGPRSDDATIIARNADIPDDIRMKIYAKMGDGCSVMGL